MTRATDLAMNLADAKLRLRQAAAPFRGKNQRFDVAVDAAVDALNLAIVESPDAAGPEQ